MKRMVRSRIVRRKRAWKGGPEAVAEIARARSSRGVSVWFFVAGAGW